MPVKPTFGTAYGHDACGGEPSEFNLALSQVRPVDSRHDPVSENDTYTPEQAGEVFELLQEYAAAVASGDTAEADNLEKELAALGVSDPETLLEEAPPLKFIARLLGMENFDEVTDVAQITAFLRAKNVAVLPAEFWTQPMDANLELLSTIVSANDGSGTSEDEE
jgi:hypothetical protein